jgi:membrane protease YdiL (CAAX protease family)
MRAAVLLLSIPVVMWLTQSLLLWRAGRPLQARISSTRLPARFKRINRVVTKLTFVAVLWGYALWRGASPLAYYGRFLPGGGRPLEMLYGACAGVLCLAVLYLAWTVTDNVRFAIRHPPGKLATRWLGAVFTAVLIALVEELLFRAMLLAELLETLPAGAALTLGVLAFAGGHYVRGVKRYWTFPGHVMLGVLLCVAFYRTGAIWLPMGVHAGGVLMLMVTRPVVRYVGPAWLVGASIFPYAGVQGVLALLALTVTLWRVYGGEP